MSSSKEMERLVGHYTFAALVRREAALLPGASPFGSPTTGPTAPLAPSAMAAKMSWHQSLLAPLGAVAVGAEDQGAHRVHAQPTFPLEGPPKLGLSRAQATRAAQQVGGTDARDTPQEWYNFLENNALESLCLEACPQLLVQLYKKGGA